MGSGSIGSKTKPGYPAELRQLGDLIGGRANNGDSPSLLRDIYWGNSTPKAEDLFPYLSQWTPQLLNAAGQGGSMLRDLGSQATNSAYGTMGNLSNQANGILGNPGWMDTANYYAQGLNSAINGTNVGGGGGGSWGPSGLSAQVAQAAMGAQPAWQSQIYDRAIASARPEIRAAYSSRGMGNTGQAVAGEGEMIQKITDQMAQQDVQNRIQSLGVASQAAGSAGSEGVGWGNIGLGRGNLALQGSQMPGQVQGQFLQNLAAGQQMAGAPLNALTQGTQLFQQGLQMPLQTFNNLYSTSRAPETLGVNLLGGSAGTFSNPIQSKIGIPIRY